MNLKSLSSASWVARGLAIGLGLTLFTMSCVGFRGRMMSDTMMDKGIKTDKWYSLVSDTDSETLVLGLFNFGKARSLNEMLQSMSELYGCTALMNIEVMTESRFFLVVIQRRTTLYARCMGGRNRAASRPSRPAQPKGEESYDEDY